MSPQAGLAHGLALPAGPPCLWEAWVGWGRRQVWEAARTLYSRNVMRASSSSPPTELPTMRGTGLCTSCFSSTTSAWKEGTRQEASGSGCPAPPRPPNP